MKQDLQVLFANPVLYPPEQTKKRRGNTLRKPRKKDEAEKKVELGPMLVMVGGKDLLRDRVKDYADRMSQLGIKVDYFKFEGLEHGFLANISDPKPENLLLSLIKKFVREKIRGCPPQ